tara:strand:- start:139 stop:288 length:150 start_codon:yes stop_codon:yes gene_type:complete
MKAEFKATKENLLALVEAANNTNGTGDFVEAIDFGGMATGTFNEEDWGI